MKSKSEVDSKAGTLKMKNDTKVLRNLISRSASMLLIAMAGFGMMSFTQDDTAVNNVDTDLKKEITVEDTKAVALENCCAATLVSKPGDEVRKAAYISMPRAKAKLSADVENSRLFAKEARERRIWNMNLAEARAEADREMSFNFELNRLYPAAGVSEKADQAMNRLFIEDALGQFTTVIAKKANVADAEIISQFMADHFKIAVNANAVKADASIAKAFERENLPFISLPTQVATATADAAMLQHYEAEVKVNTTVATK
ncbi:MAG: hypothetical protein KF746_26525 [Chitinophagaceae bacterium]|nr:hypothetical protein [Chitinophagaceae bacterium]